MSIFETDYGSLFKHYFYTEPNMLNSLQYFLLKQTYIVQLGKLYYSFYARILRITPTYYILYFDLCHNHYAIQCNLYRMYIVLPIHI